MMMILYIGVAIVMLLGSVVFGFIAGRMSKRSIAQIVAPLAQVTQATQGDGPDLFALAKEHIKESERKAQADARHAKAIEAVASVLKTGAPRRRSK